MYENVEDDELFVFADVDCGWYPEMCTQFSSGSYPAIALVTGTSRKVYMYQGDRESASELTDFIRRRGDGLGLVSTLPSSPPHHLRQCLCVLYTYTY